MTQEKLIKSKKRIKKYAEVYTPSFIVNNMCNLCEPDVSDMRKRVLEPACGNGAFLIQILGRRLEKCHTDFERLIALSNLYGVDIQADNVCECRSVLFGIMLGSKEHKTGNIFDYADAATQILTTNIVVGDTINHPEKIFFTMYEPHDDDEMFDISEHCLATLLEKEKRDK